MVVGTLGAAKTWHLPKELLINASPFFAAALNGSFAEATSKSVRLPEDDIDAFGLFVQWLYVGEIATDGCIHTGDDHSYADCIAATFQTLVQAWILGDKLECPNFKDHAMLGLISKGLRVMLGINTVRTAFEKSASGSKLREFILDLVRYDACDGTLEDDTDEWMSLARDCVDFGDGLMRAMFEESHMKVKNPAGKKALYLEVLMV